MPKKEEVIEVKKNELTESEKFSSFVIREFGNQVGDSQITEYQKNIIQGYFIGIDKALKVAEENRINKNAKCTNASYKNDLPISWNTIDLQTLAIDVKHYAKMELDMLQPNHLVAIPFKSKKNNNYVMTFIKGYQGIQYIAEKYALRKPKNVVTELVYSNDLFVPIKKSADSEIENYTFEIRNPFDRGSVVGGFGYIEFEDSTKNKLIVMTLKDIEKRKPKYAAAEFWGGKTKGYENGKQVEVETDGWFDEMCLKTLKREVYSTKYIELDPKKMDENYRHMQAIESRYSELESLQTIEENANSEEFVIDEPITEKEKAKETIVESEPINEDWQKES